MLRRWALILCYVAAGVCLLLAATFLLLPRGMNGPAQQTLGAATAGDLARLKDLEARGVSLNSQDPIVFNWTPLIGAVFHENTNIIAYLLTRNVNLDLQDREGQTALMWAIRMNDTNTVRLLLQKGADPAIKDKSGITACGYAEGNTDPGTRAVSLELLGDYARRQLDVQPTTNEHPVAQPAGASNENQPIRSETNRTSSAAGSRR